MIKIGKDISHFSTYSCKPKTREELRNIISERIKKKGPNCNLNDIDTSLIEDMSSLFAYSDFNGDISEWNTSNVITMFRMFEDSSFNGDISRWDVSNVENMNGMFAGSSFNSDISKWNTSKVRDMAVMFSDSVFNQDISNWKIKDDCKTMQMFRNCNIKEEFKPKSLQRC